MQIFHTIEDFELPGADGTTIRASDFRGRYLVLYFYPKANTSGCTREARDFTAKRDDFEALGSSVVGVSPDKPAALERFIERQDLSLLLASDPELELAEPFGATKPAGGLLRSTFLIDRAGVIRWRWLGVKVDGHVDEVLETLRALHDADAQVSPTMKLRRSKRAISSEPLAEAELRALVEAATLAPSCFNNQPWRVMVATGETLDALKGALAKGNAWALKAPAIVAFAARPKDDCQIPDGREYHLFDTGLAAENLMLQATRMGLVSHPMAGFQQSEVKKTLRIPEEYTVIVLIVLARPGSDDELDEKLREPELSPRQRLPLEAVIGWNEFVKPKA
jgi:peroxiredoxin/nitroreductase